MADANAALPIPKLQVSNAVTATDHGKLVVLAAWLCLTAGILLSAARVYIRWPLNALAGKDDVIYAVATALAIVQTAVTLHAVENGFGRTEAELSEQQSTYAAKTIYATDLIFVLSIWTGKLSVAFLLARLAKESAKFRPVLISKGMIYAFALISFFIVALRQHVKEPWSYRDGAVGSTLSRWIVAGVMSIAIDLVIAGMSVRLVWDLQMEPTTKSLVVTVFALRLFVAPITIVRLVSLSAVDPEDFSFSFTLPEALTQLEMYCNLISATLPSIRLFLTAWNSSFMDLRLEEVDNRAYQEHVSTQQSGGGSKGSIMGSKKQSSQTGWVPESFRGRSNAFVEAGERDIDAQSDNSERAIVVKTTVDIT